MSSKKLILCNSHSFDTRDVTSMCHKNAAIAASVGRQDLVQVWTLAALIATPTSHSCDSDDDTPWYHHPFSRSQIEYLYVKFIMFVSQFECYLFKTKYFFSRILHYAKMSDVQTAAMLCCTFSTRIEQKGLLANKNTNSKSVSATVSSIMVV